jgi:hypothetical protein
MDTRSKKRKREIEAPKDENKQFAVFNASISKPLADEEYPSYYDLIVNKSEQIPDLGPVYKILWQGYAGVDPSYCINRYLSSGKLTFGKNRSSNKDTNDIDAHYEQFNIEKMYKQVIEALVERVPLSNKIVKQISNLLVENSLSPKNEFINAIISNVNKNILSIFETRIQVEEKMNILIKLLDVSFNFKGKVDPQLLPLTQTTEKGELYYRGIGGLSPEEFKESIRINPEFKAYMSTSAEISVGVYHANLNLLHKDPEDMYVIELIPDPGINTINIAQGISGNSYNWEEEFIFPRGCILTFKSERMISTADMELARQLMEPDDTGDKIFGSILGVAKEEDKVNSYLPDEIKVVSVRVSHSSVEYNPDMNMDIETQIYTTSPWNEKKLKEQKLIRQQYDPIKEQLISQLSEEEYQRFYELIKKNTEQIINSSNAISYVYETLLNGFCREDIINDINQYLRTGNLSNGSKMENLFSTVESTVVQQYYLGIEPNKTIKFVITSLIVEKMGLPEEQLPPLNEWITELKDAFQEKLKKRLLLLPFNEKMDILIRLYDVSFNSNRKINNVDLVKTTSDGDIFYRGMRNFSAEAFKDEIQNNPKSLEYIFTTSKFNIAALNAETTDPNKFVIKLICDPGIRVINLSNTVNLRFKWKDEYVFPRGCSLNFMSLEALKSYEVFQMPGSGAPKGKMTAGPMTVVTVRVSGPDSSPSPIGGKRRTKKNRKHKNRNSKKYRNENIKKHRNRNSKKHRNRNSKKHRNRNSKKRYTRKH